MFNFIPDNKSIYDDLLNKHDQNDKNIIKLDDLPTLKATKKPITEQYELTNYFSCSNCCLNKPFGELCDNCIK